MRSLFQQIYAPIYASAGAEGELLNCGPIVQGPYCPEDTFQSTYDPAAAEELLTGDGWTLNGEGLWEKDGTVPEIRWMINTGNLRRENTQAYLIPLLREAGFNVVASNGTAEEVFQQRLPGLDYDLAMYIQHGSAGPAVPDTGVHLRRRSRRRRTTSRARTPRVGATRRPRRCSRRPTGPPTRTTRIQLVQDAIRLMETDFVLLPLANYPKVGIWRTDTVGGPVDGDLANYTAWINFDAVGGRRRRRPDRHRRRAVAGLPQPGDGVRQLVVVGVDGDVPVPPRDLGHHQRPDLRDHRPGDRGADGRDRRLTLGHRVNK